MRAAGREVKVGGLLSLGYPKSRLLFMSSSGSVRICLSTGFNEWALLQVLQLPVRRGVAGLYYLACPCCKGLGEKICPSTWARSGGLSTIVWLNDVGHQYCL
ncbi:hypothetical protein I3843_14G125700 [Carya illinoinensis]|nr:hypothetical protein I3843_14G125700 [Carya illinoinensis]